MSTWYSSWLPTLPIIDFALPSSIQTRFISFILKKSLGHFFKQGQLSYNQIDSQIGSGYVQVRDLELDNDAINALLSGLPVKLHDGSVSAVTARVPWPNPLSSTLGFSFQSLHLIFNLVAEPGDPEQPSMTNLTDSVASVAESFIHNELSPGEEVSLLESFHPDLPSSLSHAYNEQTIPGGLNPFLSNPDNEDVHVDLDPTGVSVFASLIERLLARFEFDASDTTISLIYPEHARVTLNVQELRYCTEAKKQDIPDGKADQPTSDSQSSVGPTRAVSISGVKLSVKSLRAPPSPPFSSPTSASSLTIRHSHPQSPFGRSSPPSPSSPGSSSSSLDEETQMFMSQSLASLPPRSLHPASPSSSAASSMYHSAISSTSTAHSTSCLEHRIHDNLSSLDEAILQSSPVDDIPPTGMASRKSSLDVEEPGAREEVILSFGTDPITIRLTTLLPTHISAPSMESKHPASPGENEQLGETQESLRLSVSIGTIACALRSWHIRSILDIVDAWFSHCSPNIPKPPINSTDGPPGSSSLLADLGLQAMANIRAVVILFLPPSTSVSNTATPSRDFFAHPLVPPQLLNGYLRVHLDYLSGSLSLTKLLATNSWIPDQVPLSSRAVPAKGTNITNLALSLNELSAFAFYPWPGREGSADASELHTSPVLITDPYLASQYPTGHVHPDIYPSYTHSSGNPHADQPYPQLPVIDVADWTNPTLGTTSVKLSTWRTKLKHHTGKSHQTISSSSPPSGKSLSGQTDDAKSSHVTHHPAIAINAKRTISLHTNSNSRDEVEVNILPLHIFVDLGLILCDGVMEFVDEILRPGSLTVGKGTLYMSESDDEGDEVAEPDNPISDDVHPLTSSQNRSARALQKERRRLEKLVIQDLDLDFDYREKTPTREPRQPAHKMSRKQKTQSQTNIVANLPMIRIQVRCPSPRPPPRSGTLLVDLHSICISTPNQRGPSQLSTRFTDIYNSTSVPRPADIAENATFSAECKKIVVASSLARESKAIVIISLGSLASTVDDNSTHPNPHEFGPGNHPYTLQSPLYPRFSLTHSVLSKPPYPHNPSGTNTLAFSLDVPSAHIDLSKAVLDGLQLWADDLAQLIERTFGDPIGSDTEKAESKDPSLIGSRFFMKSRRMGSMSDMSNKSNNTDGGNRSATSETVAKIAVTEVFVRLALPRGSEDVKVQPLDILASDVNVLLELRPEGKDETVVTVGIMDMNIVDTAVPSRISPVLSLTGTRSLSTIPRPLLKLRLSSLTVPETTAKETRIRLTLCGFTYYLVPDLQWVEELKRFFKAPPGAFESVVPSERTSVMVKIVDGSIRAVAPSNPGSLVVHFEDLQFTTDIVGSSPDLSFHILISAVSIFLTDDVALASDATSVVLNGAAYWKRVGFALIAEAADLNLRFKKNIVNQLSDTRVAVDRLDLRLHFCADTIAALTAFSSDLASVFTEPSDVTDSDDLGRKPSTLSYPISQHGVMSAVDEHAFRRAPEVGPAPDMIDDDLPNNLDYLDESFSAAAGLRELRDDDVDDFDTDDHDDRSVTPNSGSQGIISNIGGETIKVNQPIRTIENYFNTLPPQPADDRLEFGNMSLRLQFRNSDIALCLYEGYDWERTRKTIEDGVKEMKRRLAKIKQLVASGQTQDPNLEETSTLLYNSVYIGLDQDTDGMDPGALIAAIDEELNEDLETVSQSSWQSLRSPPRSQTNSRSTRIHGKRLKRSKGPSIEFRLLDTIAEFDVYHADNPLVSRTFVAIKNVEILDHIKTSTWKKFLTELRQDSQGNVREADSNMVRVELHTLHPVPRHPSKEARLRAKILPLRLHVDQDALDFLKKFFSFSDPNVSKPVNSKPSEEIYFQRAEIFPVGLKLDYKPRRVDYRALREGRTIELMNFFHFDGAEMTLRHITLFGITGWPRLFDMLNDLWTPDVKATQLVDVISGVSPIRSVVNVGSGLADLVLLPIAQYKKDGRIVRGVQKGTTAFVKSTAIEAIKLGARLATGTQVILEQAENVLGGQFDGSITAEAMQVSSAGNSGTGHESSDEDEADMISKYAEQPGDLREGVQSAYKSLQRNFNSAAQTILAVPMEVYEKSGNEGPVRAVIRAVPIAVLKPMIGASEAVSKTLMGLHNTLDPNVRAENEAKYKQR